ncbi:MAG: hypothetical protein AAB675_02035 [Patescibacteria group bacterium]
MKRTESIHPELVELHKAYSDRVTPLQKPTAKSPLYIVEPEPDILSLIWETGQQLDQGCSVLFLSVGDLGEEALRNFGRVMLKREAMVTIFDKEHLPKGNGLVSVNFSSGMSIRAVKPTQT